METGKRHETGYRDERGSVFIRLSADEFNRIRDIIFDKYYEKMLNENLSFVAEDSYNKGFDEGYDVGYADGYMKAKKEADHNGKNA